MKIALAADHGGFKLKQHIKKFLQQKNHDLEDFGCHDENSVDYPDFGFAAAEAVAQNKCDFGIVFCTTGIGMSIVANKVPGIRAALCLNEEMGRLAREHNHANILSLAAKYTDEKTAEKIVESFLATPPGGDRHARRVNKINSYKPN